MNIIIVNGSPRKKGTSSEILKYFQEYFNTHFLQATVEVINLIDCNIQFCSGCKVCYRTGKCIITDDGIETIHDKIKNCSAIIFASPTYASNVTGLFKTFHDRVHMTMEQLLFGKPCINVTVFENAMGSKTIRIMKEMVMNAGGYTVCSLKVKNEFNKKPLDAKIKRQIEKSGNKLIGKIAGNKTPLLSKLYTKIAVHFFMKPFVYKNKEANQGIINSWVEYKIL